MWDILIPNTHSLSIWNLNLGHPVLCLASLSQVGECSVQVEVELQEDINLGEGPAVKCAGPREPSQGGAAAQLGRTCAGPMLALGHVVRLGSGWIWVSLLEPQLMCGAGEWVGASAGSTLPRQGA